ncbi:MAG: cell division protein ZapA [Flavobacteriales bacterium]
MSSVSIKVNIANRDYPMKISGDEQDLVRKAAKLIEQKIKEFEQAYAVKDKQDVLAMCALQFVVEKLKLEAKPAVEDDSVAEKLEELEKFVSDYLKDK